MLTAIYWIEHRTPNEGARERTQGAEVVCSPIRGTSEEHMFITSTPQSSLGLNHQSKKHMVGLMALAAYVAEDGLVGHQWEERPLVL